MNKLYHKIPFVLELILNGLFLGMFIYSGGGIDIPVSAILSTGLVKSMLVGLTYLAPVVVFISIINFYFRSNNFDDFVRKHIFSLIIFVPLIITFGDTEFTFWLSAVHLFSTLLSLYEVKNKKETSIVKSEGNLTIIDRLKLAPAQIVILSFSGIILIGTLLLALPISVAEGKDIALIDAFFTATSATCVTGLSTLSLLDNFSFIGQIIALLLIQIGGLGFMTLSSSMTILLGKSLAVKNQVMMQDLLDISSFEDLVDMIVDIIKYTLVIELFGAIILTIGFSLEGYEFGQSLYYGIFHSISAFCNAGFALFNNSLENFSTSPLIHGTISVLIVLGGLGFIVLKELESVIFRKRKIINLSVHSKIVFSTNFVLIVLVAVYIFFSEYIHALDGMGLFEQIQVSVFQSITTRTAGFNTIGLNDLHPHTLYLFALIMFIGASPGSTGGGIKTTTFAILFQSVKATLRGKDRVEFFDRTVPNIVVVRATAIIVISLLIVSFFILLMMRIETEHGFLSIFFEVVSAFATVGLSLGITPYLTAAGKLSLIALMFIGRVGPLTLALAIGQKKQVEGKIEYPDGRVLIG
jgi:trk system potassium uptake protein TrkH